MGMPVKEIYLTKLLHAFIQTRISFVWLFFTKLAILKLRAGYYRS